MLAEAELHDVARDRAVATARAWLFPASLEGPAAEVDPPSHGPDDGTSRPRPPEWHGGYPADQARARSSPCRIAIQASGSWDQAVQAWEIRCSSSGVDSPSSSSWVARAEVRIRSAHMPPQ
jgi:hypothetical protein